MQSQTNSGERTLFLKKINPSINCIMISIVDISSGIFYNQPNLSPCAIWNPNATTFANSTTIGLQPRRIFINTENTIFVSSSDLNEVIVWTEGNDIPTRIISGGLNNSHGLFVTGNGDIYVDNGDVNHRVDKWTPNATVSVPVMNITSRCYFMFIDINSTLYCTLDLEHKVVKISLFDSSKTVTVAAGNGSAGADSSMLYYPNGVVVDLNFNLYVADQGNNRIQIFRQGNLTGSTLSTGSYTLNHPNDLAFDSDGYLFIIEYQSNRVVRFGPTGFICIIGCSALAGSTSYQLNHPFQISFDSFGNLFVVDQNNARIQKFFLATNSCGKCDCTLKWRISLSRIYFYFCSIIYHRCLVFVVRVGVTFNRAQHTIVCDRSWDKFVFVYSKKRVHSKIGQGVRPSVYTITVHNYIRLT